MTNHFSEFTSEDLIRELVKRSLQSVINAFDPESDQIPNRTLFKEMAKTYLSEILPEMIVDGYHTNAPDDTVGLDFYVEHFADKLIDDTPELRRIQVTYTI